MLSHDVAHINCSMSRNCHFASIVCTMARPCEDCLLHVVYVLAAMIMELLKSVPFNWRRSSTEIWATTWQNQQSDCAPNEDSDQPGHPPSLIRVFAVCMKKAWILSYPLSAQRRLWSDWSDAQADLSLSWAHSHFVGFVMSRLNYVPENDKTYKIMHLVETRICLRISSVWSEISQ